MRNYFEDFKNVTNNEITLLILVPHTHIHTHTYMNFNCFDGREEEKKSG